ncbi:MAG: hypothetical protein J6D20_04315 [Clostridia bacterium]|nr:hypothetical protein [Clostridia bacterium]
MNINIININIEEESFRLLCSAVSRSLNIKGCRIDGSGYPLTLKIDGGLREDEYLVHSDSCKAIVTSGGVSGVFAGAGKFLRKSSFDGVGGFEPYVGDFSLRPENPIHGIYFATHFSNFYESAPIEEVQAVIEDCALRGCNALMMWYDMFQYDSVDTPESLVMIARLKALFNHAISVGMKTVLCSLANEAFRTSDPLLRAEWTAQNGYIAPPGHHYHVEICPSKEGGISAILEARRSVLDALSDIRIDYVAAGPYDQGGCTCKNCAPWGGVGYMKMLDALIPFYKETLPSAKLLGSTWYFDRFYPGEWDVFYKTAKEKQRPEVEYLIGFFSNAETDYGYIPKAPDFIKKSDFPIGKGILAFSEISMYKCRPWGGYGASPLPSHFEKIFNDTKSLYSGALPYSEGIFEDINKALMFAFYSGEYSNSRDVITEYGAYEFALSGDRLNDFVEMIYLMETSHVHYPFDEDWNKVVATEYSDVRLIIDNPENVEKVKLLCDNLHATLPELIKNSQRWQLIRLRALIDYELFSCDMHISETCEGYMQTLCNIYHTENGRRMVSPPTRMAMHRELMRIRSLEASEAPL